MEQSNQSAADIDREIETDLFSQDGEVAKAQCVCRLSGSRGLAGTYKKEEEVFT